MHEKLKVVTIGGGTGQYVLLSGLRDIKDFEITAIVSMADSGGSTGRLRDELGILPPGDILKCILALSPYRDTIRAILLKRFATNTRLRGHNAGNMLLTMLSQYTGSFAGGVQALSEILNVRGTILPVSTDKATLVAKLSDGSLIYGEKAIDLPKGADRERIIDIFLVPHHSDTVSVYPPVLKAIDNAEYIIIGPGDLYTSILSNLIVPGIKEALHNTDAKILYIVNIMTKYGETHQFTGFDFVKQIENSIKKPINGIIYNSEKPDSYLIKKYLLEKSEFVEIDKNSEQLKDKAIYKANLLDTSGDIARHDPTKLANLLKDIMVDGWD